MAATYYRLAPMKVAQQFREKGMGTVTHISGNRAVEIESVCTDSLVVVMYRGTMKAMLSSGLASKEMIPEGRKRVKSGDNVRVRWRLRKRAGGMCELTTWKRARDNCIQNNTDLVSIEPRLEPTDAVIDVAAELQRQQIRTADINLPMVSLTQFSRELADHLENEAHEVARFGPDAIGVVKNLCHFVSVLRLYH